MRQFRSGGIEVYISASLSDMANFSLLGASRGAGEHLEGWVGTRRGACGIMRQFRSGRIEVSCREPVKTMANCSLLDASRGAGEHLERSNCCRQPLGDGQMEPVGTAQ